MKDGKEACEPAEDRDGRQFHDALDDGGKVKRGDDGKGVAQKRNGVLGRSDPDGDAERDKLYEAGSDEGPTDGACPRIYGLVYQGRRPPEVAKIRQGDISWVWAAGINIWKW